MSNNLDLSQVATNQNQKETTINDQAAELDAALTERLAVDLSSANVSLTSSQFCRNLLFYCSGNTVARTLTVPAVKRSIFAIENAGTYTLSIVRGTTTLTLAAGGIAFLATDGTTNGLTLLLTSKGIYDVGFFIAGSPTDGELVLRLVAGRTFTLPASLTGSVGNAGTAPDGAVSFDIQKNGSSIGSATFASASSSAAFTFASAITFTSGDVLEVYAPGTADGSMADISFILLATQG